MRHPFALQNSLFPMAWERKPSAFYPSLTTQIAPYMAIHHPSGARMPSAVAK